MSDKFISLFNSYGLSLPDTYTIEENNSIVNVFDENYGYGSISISCYDIPEDYLFKPIDELSDFAKTIDEYIILDNISVSKNTSWASFISNDKYWLIYLKYQFNKAVFATYNCTVGDESQEKEVVEGIMNSIEILSSK